MQVELKLYLKDTEENRKKEKLLSKLEILFDDVDNVLPEEYFNFIKNMKWNTNYKIIFEEY